MYMSIAKMSVVQDSYHYFTIAVDDYKERCMEGIIYQAGKPPGICYSNFLDMVLHMERIFDRLSCPKQTVELRRFPETEYPVPAVTEYKNFRKGKIATFQIYVRFRYHASWQGDIIWLDRKRTFNFESLLQMMRIMDKILTGRSDHDEPGRTARVCQIAVNSSDRGLMAGSVRNAFINQLTEFKGTISLADAMVHLFQVGIGDTDRNPEKEKVVSEAIWEAYRMGGERATFLIKILYRQHSSWQGIIYWRETGEKQAFRSFMEMVFLMASALESGMRKNEFKDKTYIGNREPILLEG